MTQDPKQAFTRYEELKIQTKAMADEMEELKPLILENIKVGQEVEGESGLFTVRPRTTYKFSADHKVKAKELKDLEADEKAKGIAKESTSYSLYYNPFKEEE